jgi:hypothetical protein
MKLLFFIPVWKRPKITEICFMGISRLRGLGIHEIEALAIISEDEMKPLCEKYGIEWCFYKNQPLGEKKNYGLSQALKKDFDYLIEVGSDDLLKNDYLTFFPWNLPVMSLSDFLIMDSLTGNCRRISGKVVKFGTGRAIRKDVLPEKIWHDKATKGMDNTVMIRLAINGVIQKWFKSDEPLSIDIKSEVNIWHFSKSQGKKYPTEKALIGLSVGEINAIQKLHVAA